MILIIDNYDSFSYNLYQLAGEIQPNIKVIRNDMLQTEQIRDMNPDKIIISPGPGRPENAGNIIQIIQQLGSEIPILGVCLGHQAVCAAFGGKITYAKKLMHGKQSPVCFDTDCPLFRGCQQTALAARYHSLTADPASLPQCLKVTAWSGDGEIMAVQHKDYPIFGLQFHPESIMTPDGRKIISNFINS